jgi:penicillin-binding protein 1C
LKPLLYALALEHGKTLADVLVDAPLTEHVGDGLHQYRNYSERYYGPVTLRDALANSLNIPALKLLHELGTEAFLGHLGRLGMHSLREHPDIYGDGLALGNGEVTLLELVQAYQALANRGRLTPLTVVRDSATRVTGDRQVVAPEVAALIGNVLSDPDARALEFGRDSVLNLPVQTAVKTGTSSDYRDAWVIGFDSRFTVGIWMGDLDRTPTRGVTGSIGPGLLLRSVLAELNRDGGSRPLYLIPELVRRETCVPSPQVAPGQCLRREEWFDPAHAPVATAMETLSTLGVATILAGAIRLRQPTPGLELAFDPRLPAAAQAYRLLLDGVAASDRVEWRVDGDTRFADGDTLIWPVSRGAHEVLATVRRDGVVIAEIAPVGFSVR